ncbi:hypothetical protein ENBRE01_1889 [Enteropsectra breve]|nr:hypothetical protein ENBRE01_1889 [Enteropsectra breve]
MPSSRTLIIGDTPGTYICAIYIFTANLPVKIIKKPTVLSYKCTFVPGCPGTTKEKFNNDTFLQAKNMGIEIEENEKPTVEYKNGKYIVNNEEYEYLVLDTEDAAIEKSKNLFFIEKELIYDEAIEVAGAGCKVAFHIKEAISNSE